MLYMYIKSDYMYACMYTFLKSNEESSGRALISFVLFLTCSSLPVYSEKLGMKRAPLYLNQISVYTTEQSTCLDEKAKEGALLLELIIHKMQ